jgi:hypothetical protein
MGSFPPGVGIGPAVGAECGRVPECGDIAFPSCIAALIATVSAALRTAHFPLPDPAFSGASGKAIGDNTTEYRVNRPQNRFRDFVPMPFGNAPRGNRSRFRRRRRGCHE